MTKKEKNIVPQFLGLPDQFTDYSYSKVVVVPIPFDQTSTWVKGADKGPAALIEASEEVEWYDIELDVEICKLGIHTLDHIVSSTSEEMVEVGYKTVKRCLDDNKFVVTLGGEHSISEGPIRAHSEKFKNLSVLQLNAHADLRDSYHGSVYNHACVINRVRSFVDTVVSVGIRSMDQSERQKSDPDKIFFAHSIMDSDEWMEKAISQLSDNIYLTIDLNVFDPGLMPATGTPEPGGMSWYQLLKLIRKASERKKIVGFDVVELCPLEGIHHPNFVAAKLVYKVLNYVLRERKVSN